MKSKFKRTINGELRRLDKKAFYCKETMQVHWATESRSDEGVLEKQQHVKYNRTIDDAILCLKSLNPRDLCEFPNTITFWRNGQVF